MKTLSILFVLVIFSHKVNSQNNYYFGYQDGFKYACQCYDIPPKNVAYVQGSYEKGYLDGKIDGLLYIQKSSKSEPQVIYQKPHDYNQPLYEPNYEIIQRALLEKQRVIDERRKIIENKYNQTIDIVVSIAQRRQSGKLTESEKSRVKEYTDILNKYVSNDVSDNYIFYQIMDWMQKQKEYFLTWK